MNPRGFALSEMMIALVLGLVLFAGVGHLMLSSSRSWALQDEQARIQENARLALDILTQSVSTAAYTGCPVQTRLANVLDTKNDMRRWMAHFDKGILGIPLSSVKTDLDINAISEALIVHSTDGAEEEFVSTHDNASATVSLTTDHDYKEGKLFALIAADCAQISVFRAGDATGGTLVTHPEATAGNLYNCTAQLQGDFNCHSSASDASIFNHTGSSLVQLKSYAFYVRNSNNIPTLYRKLAGEASNGNSINAESLVEGIEGFSVRYGVDTNNDGAANQYLPASAITPYSDEWLSVISIKIELLVRSFQEIAPEPQPVFFAGQRVLPTDQYVRRSFMKTIRIRNRGLL